MDVEIARLGEQEKLPMKLIALADPDEKMVASYVDRGEVYVMKSDGEIIGEYVLLNTRPYTVEIMNVAVSKHAQGQGLGEKLIRDAVSRAIDEGYRKVEIGTGSTGVMQLYLYQKCGFRIVGVERDYFVSNYKQPIFENGLRLRDMVRLSQDV